MAVPMMAWGQTPAPKTAADLPVPLNVQSPQGAFYHDPYLKSAQKVIPGLATTNTDPMCCTNSPLVAVAPSSFFGESDEDHAKEDLDSCHVHQVKSFPGSHQFGSDFVEAIATDPDPKAKDSNVLWGLTADLSSKVPSRDRAMYISKSTNGGKTWTQAARVESKYFDAGIGEGERNALSVSPGGTDFVITTQRGAFQVLPQSGTSDTVVKSIAGPLVPAPNPQVSIPKREGDPVTANVAKITPDGKHLIVGYGYFDLNPQIFTYRRGEDGSWVEDRPLPRLPTQMDILSLQFSDPKEPGPSSLYLGTGDQAYRLIAHGERWTRIVGVGPDSAVQGISTVGGPHLAACWGVYDPINADVVERVTHASFLLHRDSDEAGPNIRAFGIEVDPAKPNREVVTSLTGVYTSNDRGESWKRLNDLPEGEFRSAHFISNNGTVIVSGTEGTFLANPFSKSCSSRLRTRDR